MKLGPLTKIETKQRQNNLTLMSCQKIVTSLSFFGFLANLEQSAKFEVSSIILTSFRQGVGVNFTPSPSPQSEPLKSPPRLGLRNGLISDTRS